MVNEKEYTFHSVSSNHTISAGFERMTTFTLGYGDYLGKAQISYRIGTSGSYTFLVNQYVELQVPNGSDLYVRVAITDTAYDFVKWYVVEEYTTQDYNTANATIENNGNDCEVILVLNAVTFTIAATAGAGGTISPSGNVSVLRYKSQKFTVTANSGYRIKQILVDGVPIEL